MSAKVGIRWTIGDVSPRGFVALRLSIWGASYEGRAAEELTAESFNRLRPAIEGLVRIGHE